jgi:heat shock protein HslJ
MPRSEVSEAASAPVGSWVVSGIRRDGELAPTVEGTSLSVEFDDSGRVFGSAGCNRFTAGYAATGDGSFEITEAASTRMFCSDPPGVMEQEAAFLAALSEIAALHGGGEILELHDASGSTLLALVREEPVRPT